MRELGQWLFLLFVLFCLFSCSIGGPIVNEVFSLDGIKLISEGNENLNDAGALGQDLYEVAPNKHLLMRYEEMNEKAGGFGSSKLYLQLTLVEENKVDAAKGSLKVCPVTRNWMLLATWELAHPFGPGGRWENKGGDFDAVGCVKGKSYEKPQTKEEERSLWFDLTQWFEDYPKARSMNYGLILLSDSPIQILGETSGTYSPRLNFSS